MSKRQTKAQASSSRAAPPGAFGGGFGGFGSSTGTFGSSASLLSYLAEQPDLSTVSDPNVVVNFKNLSKKDSTTKAKALEDIQAYIAACAQAQQELEDGILDAWVGESPVLIPMKLLAPKWTLEFQILFHQSRAFRES